MKKWTLFSILVFLLLALPGCVLIETREPNPTPETFLEEELAAQAIGTAKAEKTQSASSVLPYAEISDGEQTYLAFWFTWNGETVFLPIAEFKSTEISLPSCQLDPETGIAIGELFSGWEIVQDECVLDEGALENALPTIKIPGHFNDGIETDGWNIIDMHGEYADNFADIVTFIIENDLLGSGDVFISLHRTEGPNGNSYSDIDAASTYTLPAEALQITFSGDQLEDFEGADDVVYALKRAFTWKIPAGFTDLNLSPGDENWFVLKIRETKAGNNQEEEYLSEAYIQIKGVGASVTPGN